MSRLRTLNPADSTPGEMPTEEVFLGSVPVILDLGLSYLAVAFRVSTSQRS